MANAVTRAKQPGIPTEFDPTKTHIKIDALEAAKKHAKKMEDWESLQIAVDEQIAEQAAFVAWWDGAVQDNTVRLKNAVVAEHGLRADDASKQTGITKQQVSRWRGYLKKDPEAYRKRLFGRPYADAMGIPHGTLGTGIDEWYTPADAIADVRKVLGSIELDPASSDIAQKVVQAERYFTIQADGLSQPWDAKTLFMNPPYSAAKIHDFVSKLIKHLIEGDVQEAIMLVNNKTDTAWFHQAEEIAKALCFTRGRINYINADGEESLPTNGQTFFYFGDDDSLFREVFSTRGFIR